MTRAYMDVRSLGAIQLHLSFCAHLRPKTAPLARWFLAWALARRASTLVDTTGETLSLAQDLYNSTSHRILPEARSLNYVSLSLGGENASSKGARQR